MDVSSIPREFSEARMIGRRQRTTKDTMGPIRGEGPRECAGVSLAEARGLAADCQEWRRIVLVSY